MMVLHVIRLIHLTQRFFWSQCFIVQIHSERIMIGETSLCCVRATFGLMIRSLLRDLLIPTLDATLQRYLSKWKIRKHGSVLNKNTQYSRRTINSLRNLWDGLMTDSLNTMGHTTALLELHIVLAEWFRMLITRLVCTPVSESQEPTLIQSQVNGSSKWVPVRESPSVITCGWPDTCSVE
jgi:hypothetical protein